MANDAVTMTTDLAAAERRVVLSYTRAQDRPMLAALLALDDQLSDIARTTRDPMIGQMRLTWWHGALTALDTAPPPAQPVLQALAAHVLPQVRGETLAEMIDGWEGLLDDEGADRAATHATARGGILFDSAATILLGQSDAAIRQAGEGWAAAELAARSRDPALAAEARALSQARLRDFPTHRWPRALRPLGALALLARDTDRAPAVRFTRILAHRITGL